ncbi:hypothetical protein FV139_12815 [Parahaliea maris]|uniref:Uncharacterized protein n=1 Tax=Parahaliea maris TaxID=2716870 RepID=A0A5C8ZWB7_9GAMM|nr:hypothetical protein [Parahaliea maris]TXS92843.1 hypothetical protein FV139_12815 [Parahaliea maris]
MNSIQERRLVYIALLLAGALTGAMAGWQAAFWTLVQMSMVVEAIYWLGRPLRRRADFETRI